MEKNYKKINIIAALLGFAIIASFIIVGSFLDYDISSVLFKPGQEGFFGISGSILAQAPTFIGVTVAGALLLAASRYKLLEQKKNIKYGLIIFGVIGIAIGTFLSFYYALKLKNFTSIGSSTKFYVLLGVSILIAFAINGLLVFFILKNGSKLQFKKAVMVGILIMLIVAVEVIFYHVFKYLVSRPRPRYIFAQTEPLRYFENWWHLNPLKGLTDDEFTSCPSGHCANAMALPFILVALTYLKPDMKFNYRLLAFAIGFVWTLIWAFSRIFAGAHFLSDLGMGMLVTYISGIVLWNYFVYKLKINKQEEIQQEQNTQN